MPFHANVSKAGFYRIVDTSSGKADKLRLTNFSFLVLVLNLWLVYSEKQQTRLKEIYGIFKIVRPVSLGDRCVWMRVCKHSFWETFKEKNDFFACLHSLFWTLEGLGEFWRVIQTLDCVSGFAYLSRNLSPPVYLLARKKSFSFTSKETEYK